MNASISARLAVASLLALVALGLACELWLAPLRPGGSWLVLKIVPLLMGLRGMLAGRRYTFQWMSLCVWLYVAEGVVRAMSDTGTSASLGGAETVIALVLFGACGAYARATAPSRLNKA